MLPRSYRAFVSGSYDGDVRTENASNILSNSDLPHTAWHCFYTFSFPELLPGVVFRYIDFSALVHPLRELM